MTSKQWLWFGALAAVGILAAFFMTSRAAAQLRNALVSPEQSSTRRPPVAGDVFLAGDTDPSGTFLEGHLVGIGGDAAVQTADGHTVTAGNIDDYHSTL